MTYVHTHVYLRTSLHLTSYWVLPTLCRFCLNSSQTQTHQAPSYLRAFAFAMSPAWDAILGCTLSSSSGFCSNVTFRETHPAYTPGPESIIVGRHFLYLASEHLTTSTVHTFTCLPSVSPSGKSISSTKAGTLSILLTAEFPAPKSAWHTIDAQ